jgi:hypothetical protein
MASWKQLAADVPEFAAAVQQLFDAHRHKTLATVRSDGSPRISGIEAVFVDGELWFGGMWQSRKAVDLQRDPRFALHSASVDPTDPAHWPGDAKIAGRVEEITDPQRFREVVKASGGEEPEGKSHLFRAEISEVVRTTVGEPADHLMIEYWIEGHGLQRVERR